MTNIIVKKYAKIVVNHPFLVLLFALAITFFGATFYDNLIVENPSIDDILPSEFPIVQSFKKLSDDLGGGQGTAFMIVLELEPEIGSHITDIRDPEILRYTEIITKQTRAIEDVTGTTSIGEITTTLNSGNSVNSLEKAKEITRQNPLLFSRILNEKNSLTIIRVDANSGFDVKEMVKEVQKIIDETPKPLGIKVQIAGEEVAGEIAQELVEPDSQKTTMISLIAITVILLITFRSFIYSFLPITTIIFGVLWTFAFLGIARIAQSSFTSGAMSMIIGIGIDFGIQIIMRFKYELEKSKPVQAMQTTLENVLMPMTITTIAAFIGFQSMQFGDFTIIAILGQIMSYGVVFCYFAAITVVPCISLLYEKYKPSKKINSPQKILKRFYLIITGRARIQ